MFSFRAPILHPLPSHHLNSSPIVLLAYAAKHSQKKLFEMAIPLTLEASLDEIKKACGGRTNLVLQWVS
jgi:hypothetical protein